MLLVGVQEIKVFLVFFLSSKSGKGSPIASKFLIHKVYNRALMEE